MEIADVINDLQIISHQITFETLLPTLLKRVCDRIEVQKVFLILTQSDQWLIEAGESKGVSQMVAPVPYDTDPTLLPISVVRHVIQTKEPLFLQDIAQAGEFSSDHYLDSQEAKSLLCLPLVDGFNLVGILYLENNLSAGVFTPERLEFLQMLSRQAAISTVNARYCAALEQKVIEKTRELHEEAARRKAVEEEIQRLTITDPLTGLINRRHFFDQLESELLRCRRYQTGFAIVILDIDFFKRVNDGFGYQIGDQVLKALAAYCLKKIRQVDSLARFGGEEFIILLPETDLENALRTSERLRHDIEETSMATTAGPIQISVSFGVTVFDKKRDLIIDNLLERATHALNHSKERGRNRVSAVY